MEASADQAPGARPTPVEEQASVMGRLVSYDAKTATMRIQPDQGSAVDLRVPSDAQVCRGATCYPPERLTELTGRRLKVRYREVDGVAVARLVTVARPRGK